MSSSSTVRNRLLSISEYLAQNAFVAPGFHRLFTAGGLTAGLWTGRKAMDMVTARRYSDGTEIPLAQVPVLFRPIYAKMKYNPYADDATDRWKGVADRFAPLVLGGTAAWAGSQFYAYGKSWNGKPFHGPTVATMEKYGHGQISMQVVDAAMRLKQADKLRVLAATGFVYGSASGLHLPGAFAPISSGGGAANTFMLNNEKQINLFGIQWANRTLFNNRTMGSNHLRPAMAEAANWMEANLTKLGHPDTWLQEADLARHVKGGLQNFLHVTPEMEANLAQGMRNLMTTAHEEMERLRAAGKTESEISKAVYAHLTGERPMVARGAKSHSFGLMGKAFDNLLHHNHIPTTAAGPIIRLQDAQIGKSGGGFSFLARLLGSGKAEAKIEQAYAGYLKTQFNIDYGASKLTIPTWKKATAWGSVIVVGAGLVSMGFIAADRLNKRLKRTHEENDPHHGVGNDIHQQHSREIDAINEQKEAAKRQQEHASGFQHWLNGKPLDVMQWLGRVTITPPSLHRFMSAAFLSGTLVVGMELANTLAGRHLKLINGKSLSNSLIPKEKTWKILEPLYGKLAYTPGSMAVADRWKQAAHYLIPVVVGASGTYAGSAMYFKERFKKLEHPNTLEEYADKISAEQSKPFGALTAVTSIFNTGSGLHLLPFVNYSSNMHNRFVMGSGQQVAMPGLGKWWSGNAGLMPWGINNSLKYTSNYLTYNEDARPRELSSLVHSIIGKLYPTLDYETVLEKKQIILNRIYEVRDSYVVDGKIPKEKQETLHEVMKKLLTGEGFEDILQLADLDPAKASLSSNGASGKIANALGKGNRVAVLEQEYRTTFAERVAKSGHVAPAEYLHMLADRSAEYVQAVSANEVSASNGNSFADRVRQEPKRSTAISS